MKPKWLDRELFVTAQYYTLCTSEKMFRKALKHLKIKRKEAPTFIANWHSDATVHTFENRGNRCVSAVVCLRNFENKSAVAIAGILVHEAVHVWQETRDYFGETSPSRELEAYAIQNIAQRLMSEFERQTKKDMP
jgi:hypothetical protein